MCIYSDASDVISFKDPERVQLPRGILSERSRETSSVPATPQLENKLIKKNTMQNSQSQYGSPLAINLSMIVACSLCFSPFFFFLFLVISLSFFPYLFFLTFSFSLFFFFLFPFSVLTFAQAAAAEVRRR